MWEFEKESRGMWRFNRLMISVSTLILLSARWVVAEESLVVSWIETLKKHSEETMYPKTLGGRQFWGDVHHLHGWRIQQNIFTKHCRLIDPDDLRCTWGSFDDCRQALTKIAVEQKLPRMKGSAVILIHGLLQSSKCMEQMAVCLEDAGFTTVEFDYPSTQVSIPEAAQYLDQVIDSLEGIDEIHFVVHSMGGLVVRAYQMEFDDQRIQRLVMLGTPNRGAELADLTHQYWALRTAAGPGGRQLGTRTDGLIPKLPIPRYEFAVIAGSRGTPSGWNPLIPGDDDGTVTVASTQLEGAADFTTINATHSRLLWNDEALTQTVHFLKEGRLKPNDPPQPIRKTEEVNKRSKPD